MIVFHSWCANLKGIINGLCKTYPTLVVKKEFPGINRLHLSSTLDVSCTVSLVTLKMILVAFENAYSLIWTSYICYCNGCRL